MAETTRTTASPRTWLSSAQRATCLMRSIVPTEVPPNFWTIRPPIRLGKMNRNQDLIQGFSAVARPCAMCEKPGMSNPNKPFEGKRALILGVANERSLAWAVAQHLHAGGAQL